MTADPLVYDRKNKRKILTHIDGSKQYFTLNNREIQGPEQPYSDELRKNMWKAYQLGREHNYSHNQVMDYMRSYPQMNKTVLDEIAQRGTEAIPDIESDRNLPLHEPYQFKSDSDIRDIRRSEDEDVMSEAYHNVRFNGGSQADAEKAVREVAKKYNIYRPHVDGYLARTKTYRDTDFNNPEAKAEWESEHTNQESDSWLTPEFSRKIDRIINGFDPNRDMRDERPIQSYPVITDIQPEQQYVSQALSNQKQNKRENNKAEPMAADYTRVYPDVVPIPIESEEYDLPEENPALESQYVSQGITLSDTPAATQQTANQVIRTPALPNLNSALNVPIKVPAKSSQHVLDKNKVRARLDALPDKAISSEMPSQAKPVSEEKIQQNAAESMVRAAYKHSASETPKRQQETKSQDVNGNTVLEQPSKYEVPEINEKTQQSAKQLTEEEIVNGVLHGDYKNGADRINNLRALGLNDAEIKHIQDIVNARIYAGRAMVQRRKTAPRAPKRVSRQQMYNGFPVNYRSY